jgi:hypothetical protein
VPSFFILNTMNLSQIAWKVAEMKGYAHYAEQGWRILVSVVDNTGYDFAIERDGVFKSVNVKVAGRKDLSEPDSWSVSQPGNRRDISMLTRVDILLVWMPEHERFIELPGEFLRGHKCRRIRRSLFPTK